MSTRKCPFCAELIQAEAIKCRYCGEFFQVGSSSDTAKRSTLNAMPHPVKAAPQPIPQKPSTSSRIGPVTATEVHTSKGSVWLLWLAGYLVLLFILPAFLPVLALVLGLSLFGLAAAKMTGRANSKFVSRLLMLRTERRVGFRLFVRVSIACWLIVFSASVLFGNSELQKKNDLFEEQLIAAEAMAADGQFAEALAALLELERASDFDDLTEANVNAFKSSRRSFTRQYGIQKATNLLSEAKEALGIGKIENVIKILSEIEKFPESPVTKEAIELRTDSENASSEPFLKGFLADLDEAEFASLLTGPEPIKASVFSSQILNEFFFNSLLERRTELSTLREDELNNRKLLKEEEVRRIELAERQRRRKVQVLYAKRVDNIRRGPGVNFEVARKTARDEKLIYFSKQGAWFKLDTDNQVESWVHESVVLTADEKRGQEVRAAAEKARQASRKWYEGGTLHSGTIGQWRSATHADKLATAGDWLMATTWSGRVKSPKDFRLVRAKAEKLVREVDEVARIGSDGAVPANMKLSGIVASVILLSNDLGPD